MTLNASGKASKKMLILVEIFTLYVKRDGVNFDGFFAPRDQRMILFMQL